MPLFRRKKKDHLPENLLFSFSDLPRRSPKAMSPHKLKSKSNSLSRARLDSLPLESPNSTTGNGFFEDEEHNDFSRENRSLSGELKTGLSQNGESRNSSALVNPPKDTDLASFQSPRGGSPKKAVVTSTPVTVDVDTTQNSDDRVEDLSPVLSPIEKKQQLSNSGDKSLVSDDGNTMIYYEEGDSEVERLARDTSKLRVMSPDGTSRAPELGELIAKFEDSLTSSLNSRSDLIVSSPEYSMNKKKEMFNKLVQDLSEVRDSRELFANIIKSRGDNKIEEEQPADVVTERSVEHSVDENAETDQIEWKSLRSLADEKDHKLFDEMKANGAAGSTSSGTDSLQGLYDRIYAKDGSSLGEKLSLADDKENRFEITPMGFNERAIDVDVPFSATLPRSQLRRPLPHVPEGSTSLFVGKERRKLRPLSNIFSRIFNRNGDKKDAQKKVDVGLPIADLSVSTLPNGAKTLPSKRHSIADIQQQANRNAVQLRQSLPRSTKSSSVIRPMSVAVSQLSTAGMAGPAKNKRHSTIVVSDSIYDIVANYDKGKSVQTLPSKTIRSTKEHTATPKKLYKNFSRAEMLERLQASPSSLVKDLVDSPSKTPVDVVDKLRQQPVDAVVQPVTMQVGDTIVRMRPKPKGRSEQDCLSENVRQSDGHSLTRRSGVSSRNRPIIGSLSKRQTLAVIDQDKIVKSSLFGRGANRRHRLFQSSYSEANFSDSEPVRLTQYRPSVGDASDNEPISEIKETTTITPAVDNDNYVVPTAKQRPPADSDQPENYNKSRIAVEDKSRLSPDRLSTSTVDKKQSMLPSRGGSVASDQSDNVFLQEPRAVAPQPVLSGDHEVRQGRSALTLSLLHAPAKPPRGLPSVSIHEFGWFDDDGEVVQPDLRVFQASLIVFLREPLEQHLDQARANRIRSAVISIQKHIRGYLARQRYERMKRSAVKIQSTYRGYAQRRDYLKIRRGVVRTQANWRMKLALRSFRRLQESLALKREAERRAREAERERLEREEREREKRERATFQHLDVPEDLQLALNSIDDWQCPQGERNIVKANERPQRRPRRVIGLPADIDAHVFSKFTNIYFKSHQWGLKREPITTPFLAKAHDQDNHDSVAIFKLILRFMYDPNLTGKRERLLGDYVVQRGLARPSLRDEILCQLTTQTCNNPDAASRNRCWLLMANCLSCFPPSRTLYKYLLKYVSDHAAVDNYACHCQRLLLRIGAMDAKLARTYPPSLLEWRNSANRFQIGLEAHTYDQMSDPLDNGAPATIIEAHSWSSGQEFAADLLHTRGIEESHSFGWSADLIEDGGNVTYSLNGADYLLDLISETEIAPGFDTCKSYYLVSCDRSRPLDKSTAMSMSGPHHPDRYNVYEADLKELPPLPANPPPANRQAARGKASAAKTSQPAPPLAMARKAPHHMSSNALAGAVDASKKDLMTPSRSRSMDDLLDGDGGSVAPPPLSKRSALNDRYFEVRRSHQQLSTHNDSLVGHDDMQSDADDDVLPLSTKSRLNQRYLSQQAAYQGQHQQGDMADGRSSSIPDISELSPIMNAGGERPHPAWQRKLGLSASALNERYFDGGGSSADDGARGPPGSMPVTEQTIEPQDKFARDRPPAARPDYRYPRHPKSKRSAQGQGGTSGGSHSSRATRGAQGEYTRSSAMSDCSEAPSLASHVRHVKVPSHTADLDQYLDELFNPVLDGDDGLSDARSLAASLKGRQRDFDDDSLIEAMSDPVRLSRKIKGMMLDDDADRTGTPVVSGSKTPDPVFPAPPPPPPPMPTPAQLGLSGLIPPVAAARHTSVPVDQPLEVQTASLSFDDDEVLSLAEDSIGMMWQDPVALSARIKGVTQAVDQQGAMAGAGVPGLAGMSPGAAALFGFGTSGQRGQGPASPGGNGMTVPIVDASQLIQQQVLQQHMMQMQQRAFLASAVQQNLQIQQQLMQQSAALQQLLQSSVIGAGASSPGQSVEDGLQSIQSTTSAPANLQKGLFPSGLNLMSPLLLSQSPGVGQDLSTHSVPSVPTQPPIGKLRKFSERGGAGSDSSSGSSNKSNFQNVLSELKMKAGSSGPPDPPLSPTSAKKRAADLYGRAKTIRIGKWRWPPPRDDKGNCIPAPGQPTSFSEFKRLKREAKKQAKRDAGLAGPDDDDIEVSSSDDEKYMHGNPYSQMSAGGGSGDNGLKSAGASNKDDIIKAFEGRSRPDPGSIGKIRISNEMKSKLEQLTIDHSVRSKGSSAKGSPGSAVSAFKQLNDERKIALERQLQGWSDNQGHKWTDGRAQPRPVGSGVGAESDAESFHVDNLVKNKIKKMERVSQQINERGIHPIGNGEQASPNSSGKSYGYDDNSGPDSPILAQNKKNQRNQLGPPPPPPGASGKKQSSEYEDVKETSTPLLERSNRPPVQQQTQTKLYPLPQTPFLMYTNTRWELRIRKEVFSPAETLTDPKAVHLIFAQIVREVLAGTTIRLTASEIGQMRSLLAEFGVTESNVNAAAAHKPHVKKAIIEQCREFPNYFARIFPVSTGSAGRHSRSSNSPELLGVSHSGVRLLRRERDSTNGRDHLRVLDTISFDDVADVSLARVSTVQLLLRDGRLMTLYSPKAPHIHSIVERFTREALREGGGGEFVRALADYVTSEDSLLSFRRGDIIRLLNKPANQVNVPKGWLFGALDTGESGLFPVEYVASLQTPAGQDIAAIHHPWSHAEHNKDETRTPTSREVRRTERADQPPKRSPLTESNGIGTHGPPMNGVGPLHEHIGSDNELDGVGDLNIVGPGGLGSPIGGPLEPNGKFSMLQFAVFNFRESLEKYDVLRDRENHSIRGSIKMLELLKQQNKQGKKKGKKGGDDDSDWTWRELTELVKFSKSPLHKSLLPLDSNELNKVAVDCFIQIMRYMGDYPMAKGLLEVDCVYSVLSTLHKYPMLHDEVYCQLIKQCTSNKSSKPDSCQKGWRLLSIVTAYFDCSDNLRPYLFHFLETAAFDKRRAFHGTAMVCLHNLRKTFRYGGRKNVPSIEEIAAISAGRNSKRQMYRLPGGTERVINTRSTTVVDDIIEDICSVLGVTDPLEMEEFSLYCIVEGDPFTMPLSRDEYILDVTTELLKNDHVFYLIFCRSVWYFNLRLDNQLYIEVIFNQVAPDYLEGLLLVTEGDELPKDAVQDIARIAALLHRAANMQHIPTKDEVKYLLPKPVLPMKDIKPPQWVESVQQHWPQALAVTTTEAKAECLAILEKWPLFGSCFFNVKWMRSENTANEQVLALNREGVHFLDVQTHNTVWMQPFSEVISTRKVQAEDGTLFLDMKCGNLMQQKITRIQTEQAHEISRLVRQYINIEQGLQSRGGPGGRMNAGGTQNMTLTRH